MSWMRWSDGVEQANCCPWPQDCNCSPQAPAPAIDLSRSGDDWERTLRLLQRG